MAQSIETKIKRAESTAKTYDVRGKRCWAYAKNGKGDEITDMPDRLLKKQENAEK